MTDRDNKRPRMILERDLPTDEKPRPAPVNNPPAQQPRRRWFIPFLLLMGAAFFMIGWILFAQVAAPIVVEATATTIATEPPTQVAQVIADNTSEATATSSLVRATDMTASAENPTAAPTKPEPTQTLEPTATYTATATATHTATATATHTPTIAPTATQTATEVPPTETPTTEPTTAPTRNPSGLQAAALNEALEWPSPFQINFEDGESPWFVGQHSFAFQASLKSSVTEGVYIWDTIGTGGTFLIEKLDTPAVTDFLFEMDGSVATQLEDACLVMSFRVSNNAKDYYQWQVCQDNTYSIYKQIDENGVFAVERQPIPTAPDLTLATRLTIIGTADTFLFFIDDAFVTEWQDAELSRGDLRYGAEIKADDRGTFTFDNFIVRVPN